MTLSEILTELVGHYAYDDGATDSGVHDPKRKAELRTLYLETVKEDVRAEEARWYRDYWLSEEAISQGYGAEDVFAFMKWMEYDL